MHICYYCSLSYSKLWHFGSMMTAIFLSTVSSCEVGSYSAEQKYVDVDRGSGAELDHFERGTIAIAC